MRMILKNVLIESTCNIFNTANSTTDIIQSMGMINNITDMINAGIVSGTFISFLYVITVIIIIIMRIFGLF